MFFSTKSAVLGKEGSGVFGVEGSGPSVEVAGRFKTGPGDAAGRLRVKTLEAGRFDTAEPERVQTKVDPTEGLS